MPAALPDNEASRLLALHDHEILDTLPEQLYDDIVELASAICETPIALISLVDGYRQWFKAQVGLDVCETPREQSFCAYAILQPSDIMVVEDAHLDPRFQHNPLVTEKPFIRFYAGAPLVTDNGYALGTLCVIDSHPRQLEQRQRRALAALARQTVALLTLRRHLLLPN
ncbi:GAF domain-containing protein [Idiomarina xiamenensis]|uniref:Diguanylate cyclase with gaf sensor n=1 Tax=Idiomarina xiamenensis 10-D-4 TaxID=740709 RepID=K2KB69_9GAMM|nr:GAF domain-containing protein [Idiomarina xiamenensis]EKE83817.1 diguanylate cyclase with gaf sensor [Idiomarina xiamenensis 10-D-4]